MYEKATIIESSEQIAEVDAFDFAFTPCKITVLYSQVLDEKVMEGLL